MNMRPMSVALLALLTACQPEQQEAAKAAVQGEAVPAGQPASAAAAVTHAKEEPVAAVQAAPVTKVQPKAAPAQPKPVAPQPKVESPVTPPQAPVAAPAPTSAPAPVAAAQAGLSEAEALALAKKRNCFACHMVDKKVVGPAWKDVAAKYRGDAGAQARLEAKIAKGGSGAWGSMAMPPQPQVSAEERAQLVRFILNLK